MPRGSADVQNHTLSVELYRKLYLVRRSEEYIIMKYPEDEMKTPMHMSMGQEAIPVGICHALGEQDQILVSYRTHAAFLAKSGDTNKFFAELFGREGGTADGKAGSMHLADPKSGHVLSTAIVTSAIPPAIGLAFANKTLKNGRISAAFFGDGALDEGAFWESLNAACLMSLPVLLICEDNGFAVHTPTKSRQGYESITTLVQGFNCRVIQDRTTDVERIYQLTQEALSLIHADAGPVFLHLECYRYLEHVGINEDFEAGYRHKADYDNWRKKDCVELQRNRLLNLGLPEAEIQEIESAIDQLIQASIKSAQAAPLPSPQELHTGVFYEGD